MFRSSILRDVLILALVCSVVFWWRLGRLGLIDPDEPFYAQTAREMVASGDWLTPQIFGQPQFEKPIFFYWMNAAAYKVFGETEFAGALPAAIPATLMVGLVYVFGIGFAGRRAALASALILATGLEYGIMSRLMLTDIALALFIAGALFSFWRAQEDEAKSRAVDDAALCLRRLRRPDQGPDGHARHFSRHHQLRLDDASAVGMARERGCGPASRSMR